MRRLLAVLVFVFSICFVTGNVWGQAQITTGNIQGTVMDEKGGVVADATVEVTNLDTNLTKSGTTGTDGEYQCLSLPSGRYTVTVSKAGFATIAQTGAMLTVGQVLTLPVTMKISTTQEKIEVTATPDLVDTSR
jgi:hypothetical protein